MRKQLLTLLMAVILFLLPTVIFGQTPPTLGVTSNFALFTAAGALTTDGATVVTGDIGSHDVTPVGFTGPGTVIGTIYPVGHATVNQAFTDMGIAWGNFSASGDVLGTPLQTFNTTGYIYSGTYHTIGAADLNGDFTLDAQGNPDALFVININGAFTVGAGFDILLANSAQFCNVYWQINGAFTLGAGSNFKGTIVSNGAITLNEGASLKGRALTNAGAIALHNNNVSLGELTWNGSLGTDWHTAANWDPNVVPTVDYNVTIPSGLTNYPTLSSAGACNNLTIQSASLSTGSLIAQNYLTVIGTVTIQRYMTGNKWHMMGSPLTGQAIYSEFINVGANNISDMKGFTESLNNWTALYSSDVEDLTLGKAYAIKTTTDGTVNLNGTPNTVDKTVTLARSANGWNLLSNPFTSAIAANIPASANSLLKDANTANLEDTYAALYVWVESDGYVTGSGVNYYNVVNNSSAATYLQVGQGFFVKSKTGGGSFSIETNMQSHQSATTFKSDVNPWANITLNAEISNAKASTRILYKENMTRGLDISYDAGLLNSFPTFALYSRLVEDNGVDFMVQCLPTDYSGLIVPIGLDAKAGEVVKFTAQSVNIPEVYKVYLEDRTLGVYTNLSVENAEYSIQLISDSKGTGRFFIRTSIESALGIGDLDLDNPFKVFTRPNNNQIVIRGEANANTIARIYSVTGKQVAGFNLKQSSENLVQFNEEAGIYIVKISNEQGTSTQKFAWVK